VKHGCAHAPDGTFAIRSQDRWSYDAGDAAHGLDLRPSPRMPPAQSAGRDELSISGILFGLSADARLQTEVIEGAIILGGVLSPNGVLRRAFRMEATNGAKTPRYFKPSLHTSPLWQA
jgi:hypothetical protein